MENLFFAGVIMGAGVLYFLFRICVVATEIQQELKGLRFQLAETFTPEDLDKGHRGHLSKTSYLTEQILKELQKQQRP